jgi:hypothetical protein
MIIRNFFLPHTLNQIEKHSYRKTLGAQSSTREVNRMIRIYAALTLLVCLLAQTAAAQEPKPDRTVILDISIIELTAVRSEDIEAIAKDKQRLNSLINEGKARQVASLQMRSRSGENASAQIGQRVPIQTATLPAVGVAADRQRNRADQPGANPNDPTTAAIAGVGIPQIQYENIGLNVQAKPRIVANDQVEVQLRIEQTGIERSTGTLTPTFIQRTLQDFSRVRSGETTLLFGVVQHPSSLPGTPQPAARTADLPGGSFVVLLTARIVD